MASVLIVDDDPHQITICAHTLRAAGYTVQEALGGETGYALAREKGPDLILTDVRMNGVGGIELLRRIRSHGPTAATPVIMMTAGDVTEVQRTAMVELADDILQKPVSAETLVAAVKARLDRALLIREQAERRMHSLRRTVMTALPHELQTPIAAILGYAQLLREEADQLDARDVARTAAIIEESGVRLERMVERYLAFVELEILQHDEGGLGEARTHVVHSSAELMTDVAVATATRHGRRADLDLDLCECRTRIPGSWLRRAIGELVDNAFKFSPANTRVRVVSGVDNSGFSVAVYDRGPGITAAKLRDMGPLVQFERSIHEQTGTGLGLATASSIATLFGGSLVLDRHDDGGLMATLRLPVHSDSLAEWAE